MANTSQTLAVQEKKELTAKEEKTVPARYYTPNTDIYETAQALVVAMEVPGVDRKDIQIDLESGVLRVEAKIDFGKYDGLEPIYSEYNVGHWSRAFTLSGMLDQSDIKATLDDGILTLTLPKSKEAQPRRIAIT